jgi:uncharacterized membrane-anchored protein
MIRTKVIALVLLCVAQAGAAAWSMARYESVLASGAQYRIRVAPVDPADAFRGRYVAVRPEITVAAPVAQETEQLLDSAHDRSGTVYVTLGTDADGFAQAAHITSGPPQHGDYLRVEHVRTTWAPEPGGTGESVRTGYALGFPFDRYYMNETAAPAAEQRYADAARRDAERRAWVVVRVKDGTAVIEGLFIDDVPIEAIVAAPPK